MHATLPMMLSTGLELFLSVLLAATLVYCIVLERRLAAMRKGQDGLKKLLGELNGAIAGAGASLRALKSAAGEAAETLDERLKRARAMSDELSLLTNSGERIAQRFDRAVENREVAASLPSGSVMNRLNALKAVR
jgi:ABC-type transporter Mla subunit MlaD